MVPELLAVLYLVAMIPLQPVLVLSAFLLVGRDVERTLELLLLAGVLALAEYVLALRA
jgi:hypothetical protein